ncbi:MAG: CBS domain-containing protein [Candidatus Thermoplasmatota archaeon]
MKEQKKELKVKDLMNKKPVFAEIPGSREEVLRIFGKYEVSSVPVVKAGTKKFIGMITRNRIFENPEEQQLALLIDKSPIVLSPDASIRKAAKIFYEKRIHGVPVIRKDELVGMISPPDLLPLLKEKPDKVEKYLSPICVPLYQETPLPAVMKIFRITNAPALPVVDENGELVGIVADGDLFTFSHLQESVKKSDLGIGEDEDMWTWEGIRDVMRLYYETSKIQLPSVPVKEVMVKKVITAYIKSKISDVAKKMLEHKIDQLPVINENDELVGMVYDVDLMASLL